MNIPIPDPFQPEPNNWNPICFIQKRTIRFLTNPYSAELFLFVWSLKRLHLMPDSDVQLINRVRHKHKHLKLQMTPEMNIKENRMCWNIYQQRGQDGSRSWGDSKPRTESKANILWPFWAFIGGTRKIRYEMLNFKIPYHVFS